MTNKNTPILHDDVIDLKEMFLVLWNKKKFITINTSIFAILSVLYALSLPNIYTAQTLLAPASQKDSLSSKLGNLSALASFGGLNLPSDNGKSTEAIERIKSFEFFSKYFLPNINLENIMAVKEWNHEDNTLVYNKDFDKNTKTWTREVSYPKKTIPSSQEAYKLYQEVISVSENNKTSFITISADHHSPFIAKKWVDIIIYQINESMRRVDADKAARSISYLNEKTQSTNVQSLKDGIAKLLEDQMKILMLTASDEAYILKTIDSPIAPEIKSRPNRALICILITFLGGALSILYVFIQHYRNYSSQAITK